MRKRTTSREHFRADAGKRRLLPCMCLILTAALSAGCLDSQHTTDPPPGKRPSILNCEYGTLQIFPDDNPWNQDISTFKIHPRSSKFIESIGADKPLHADFGTRWKGAPNGIPFVVVPATQKKSAVEFYYADESDKGQYPISIDVPIEGGPNSTGDRHAIMVDFHTKTLYELFLVRKKKDRWTAASGAIYDLTSNRLRPAGWTSADAAGLPIFPGLVRYDETMIQREIRHALRFTVTRTQRGYVSPARHFASQSRNRDLPPMGLRVRLKADFDHRRAPPAVRVILTALKKYGMILADNGGDWFISGAPHPKWSDRDLRWLRKVKGRDLEVVYTGETTTD